MGDKGGNCILLSEENSKSHFAQYGTTQKYATSVILLLSQSIFLSRNTLLSPKLNAVPLEVSHENLCKRRVSGGFTFIVKS